MRVAEALTHPWITDKAADVPLSAGGQRQVAGSWQLEGQMLEGVDGRQQTGQWGCTSRSVDPSPSGPWPSLPAPLPGADIIGRLQSFTRQNRAKCLLLAVAAHHLSDEEIGGLRKVVSSAALSAVESFHNSC
jgi:hypothetical protein